MHGNVKEWCWDWLGTYPSVTQTNPTGGLSNFRVLRGGWWASSSGWTRSAERSGDTPYAGTLSFELGFCLVRP